MNRDFSIRRAHPDDAALVQAIYAPYVRDTSVSFELQIPSPDDMRLRIATTLQSHPWLVCEGSGTILGYAYACQHRAREAYRWSTDVAVYVAMNHTGQGIGRLLYGELLRQLEEQGFANAFAGIALPNPASIALHESMGFVPIGVYHKVGFKGGVWHDVGWWQRAFAYPANPLAPLSPLDPR